MSVGLPLVEAVHLVEGDDEGGFLCLEQVDRLDGLKNNPDSATYFEYYIMTICQTRKKKASINYVQNGTHESGYNLIIHLSPRKFTL